MEEIIRISIQKKQPEHPIQDVLHTGRFLQLMAKSLYESGCIPLRCFLFPYVDLLQLERWENAVYFGTFLQFRPPVWRSQWTEFHQIAAETQFNAWRREQQPGAAPTLFSVRWETVLDTQFWPSVPLATPFPEAPAGQKTVAWQLLPPAMPLQRDIAYRTYAGDFLSLCQIFHRLLQSCKGTLLLLSPHQICYQTPEKEAGRLSSYLLPALKKLGFSIQ